MSFAMHTGGPDSRTGFPVSIGREKDVRTRNQFS